jgi:hypothetical protein
LQASKKSKKRKHHRRDRSPDVASSSSSPSSSSDEDEQSVPTPAGKEARQPRQAAKDSGRKIKEIMKFVAESKKRDKNQHPSAD